MKKLLTIFGCLTVALALGGFTFANTIVTEYIGANGTIVTVLSSNSTVIEDKGEVSDVQDDVKIGDIIQCDEVVFAIAENGAYITAPAE